MIPRLCLAFLAILPLGCSPVFEFLIYNATTADISIAGFESDCVARPGEACSVRGHELRIQTMLAYLTYQTLPVGQSKLIALSENRPLEAFLVRLRFDGTGLMIVAPKDKAWMPLHPQPEGFPIKPEIAPRGVPRGAK